MAHCCKKGERETKPTRESNAFGEPPEACIAWENGELSISFPGTDRRDLPWKLYSHLIEGIPEDVHVREYCLGSNWSYVWAESGMGISYTARGGAPRTLREDLRGVPLRTMAQLAKSWNMEEATLGVAALNAWYSQPDRFVGYDISYDEPINLPDGTVRKMDAFELYRPVIAERENANVVVVGHFPHVDRIAEYANLVVLERNPTSFWDTPDPGCEYLVPQADYVFMTGVAIINKTAPRLLDLAKRAHVVLVGPSVVMSPFLFSWGVEMLAGSVVADPEKCRFAVMAALPQLFGEALQMASLKMPSES